MRLIEGENIFTSSALMRWKTTLAQFTGVQGLANTGVLSSFSNDNETQLCQSARSWASTPQWMHRALLPAGKGLLRWFGHKTKGTIVGLVL